MTKVEEVELLWLDLHLARPHRAGYGDEVARPLVIARLRTGGAEGWGECAALGAPTYREEYAAGAWAVLRDHLVPRLLGVTVPDEGEPGGVLGQTIAAVGGALNDVRGHHMAKACLEMAAVDAALTVSQASLADALGVSAVTVPSGAVIGCSSDPGHAVEAAEAAVDRGFRRVKVKISPGADTVPLRAVRQRLPALVLQADANGGYGRRDGAVLAALDDVDLGCLEQPLAPWDLVGHGELSRRLRTPVCLDESVSGPHDVELVVATAAAAMLCLKPACLGGIGPTLETWRRAKAAGIGTWCGGMLQSALGRSVDAAVSGLPGMVLPGDIGGPDAPFEEADPFGPVPWHRGAVVVHRGAGVGPRPDLKLLESVVVRRHRSRARAARA